MHQSVGIEPMSATALAHSTLQPMEAGAEPEARGAGAEAITRYAIRPMSPTRCVIDF